MAWEVYLSASPLLLDELPRLFRGEELSFHRQGQQTVLRSRQLDELTDVDAVRAQANRLVEALSGIARLLIGSGSGLKVASMVQVCPDGSKHTFIQLEPAVIRVSGGIVTTKITNQDATVEVRGPLEPAPEWLAKAISDPSVARALRLRDDSGLSWTDLYRLFEVIEAGVGGSRELVDQGWTSMAQIRRLRHSANSVAAAGDDARHGVEPGQPPSNPMSLAEARAYVDGLLQNWLGR